MPWSNLLTDVTRRSGLDEASAKSGLLALARTVGPGLSSVTARAAARELPDPVGNLLVATSESGDSVATGPDVYAAVTTACHLSASSGIEAAQVMASELAARLSAGTLERVQAELDPELRPDFAVSERAGAASVAHHEQPPAPTGHTLADGQPGSTRPVSTSKPDLAHGNAVGRSVEPHQQTKLSSAAGDSHQRRGETLAAGHPGSDDPLSEAGKKA